MSGKANRKNLRDFFYLQQFDEIILIENDKATKENLDYFLGTDIFQIMLVFFPVMQGSL